MPATPRASCIAGQCAGGSAPHFNGLYLSFETDLRAAGLDDAFPPATLARLRDLRSRIDPANVFRDNFNVTLAQALTG
jgi:hypothetical protein